MTVPTIKSPSPGGNPYAKGPKRVVPFRKIVGRDKKYGSRFRDNELTEVWELLECGHWSVWYWSTGPAWRAASKRRCPLCVHCTCELCN